MKEQEQDILELGVFTARSIMGIDASRPVVVDFTQMKKNQKLVEAESDQETGKSSWETGILLAMGAAFDIPKSKLVNRKDGAIDLDQTFTYNGERFHVFVNTDRVTLKKLNDNGKWRSEETPAALIRKMFGPVGLSPLNVKSMDGKKQIEYFQQMFGTGEEATKKMRETEALVDKKFNERTAVNRRVKELSSALKTEPLFVNREESEKTFATPIKAESEKKKFDDISKKKNAYDQYQNTLNIAEADLKDKTERVKELEEQLKKAIEQRDKLQESVTTGKAWVENNKGVVTEYDKANKEWVNISKKLADQEKWKDILKKEKELHNEEDKANKLTGEIDEGREKILKLTKNCLPDVEGLTIKVATGIDKEGKPEGVFYNDKPIHELSQSAYEALWAKIFVASGVKFLFFENINNFGSATIGLLNELMKTEGVIVFGTRTNPKIKELGITFKNKIVIE